MSNALQGRRILVTRPAAQSAALAQLISAEGGEPVLFPLLEISTTDDDKPLRQAIARLDEYAIAVFISPNAVDFSLPLILAQRRWPARLRAAAIGQSTAVQLVSSGISPVLVPTERFDSEALLALPAFAADSVVGKRLLILRGNGGRELLAETLAERGATVDCVTCYQRSAPVDAAPVLARLRSGQLDALTISSSEGLRNLLALLDADDLERLRALPVFVPHQRIADMAAELGLSRVILTRPADDGIFEGLCAHAWCGEEIA